MLERNTPLVKLLGLFGKAIPGTYLKTFVYLNAIQKPRRYLRLATHSFYRMDHVYDVIREFKRDYQGDFSILEFGVADGYAFVKKLYATRYLGMADRITVHGFDSFAGMPEPDGAADHDLIANDGWVAGQFTASYTALDGYCRQRKYANYRLHAGYFDATLTPEFLAKLTTVPPMLVWFDCDYYSSARTVFERLHPYLPTGCVLYFDDIDFNFRSRFTGEARLIHEVNTGGFGADLELVPDAALSLDSRRVYRFINAAKPSTFVRHTPVNTADELRRRTNDSPFP